MNVEFIKSEIDKCDMHTKRIQSALAHTQHLRPFTPQKVENFTEEEISFIELLTNRFSKLQDTIGEKIFPCLLQLLFEYEVKDSMQDRLNKLEKLEILDSVGYWAKMREMGNIISHEYPDIPDLMSKNLNAVVEYAMELMNFWVRLRGIVISKIRVAGNGAGFSDGSVWGFGPVDGGSK
jgi:hypothetical protein